MLTVPEHSKQDHLYELLKVAKEVGIPEVYIHVFGDGRDTDPKSGAGYYEQLVKKTEEIGIGKIASITGRYYAMDRDKRWERVEVGLKALVTGEGEESSDPVATVKERYEKGENDEFLKPIIVGGKDARIKGEQDLLIYGVTLLTCTQTTTKFSSSTTDPIVSARLHSFLVTRTARHWRISHIQRASPLQP